MNWFQSKGSLPLGLVSIFLSYFLQVPPTCAFQHYPDLERFQFSVENVQQCQQELRETIFAPNISNASIETIYGKYNL